MRRAMNTTIATAISLGVLASTARAQAGSAATDCVIGSIERVTTGPWAELRPSRVMVRLKKNLETKQWGAAADSLRHIFSSPPAALSNLTAQQQSAIMVELDSMKAEFIAAERDSRRAANGQFAERFKLTALLGVVEDRYVLFNGRVPAPVDVTDSMPEAARRTVCWLAFAASDVIAALREPGLVRLADAFAKLDASWDAFMNRGYSMMPLELWINGPFVRRALLEPPRNQLIVGHASVANQVFGTSLTNFERTEVLALEPLGMIRYSSDHESYAGVSLIATFPRTGSIGAGLMLHSSWLGHAAIMWRQTPAKENRLGALISIDLYSRLGVTEKQWKQLKAAKLENCQRDQASCVSVVPK